MSYASHRMIHLQSLQKLRELTIEEARSLRVVSRVASLCSSGGSCISSPTRKVDK